MATPRRLGPRGGTTKNILALWTLLILLTTAQPQSASHIPRPPLQQDLEQDLQHDLVSTSLETSISHQLHQAQPSRSPAEIPLIDLNTDTTPRKKTKKYSHNEDTIQAVAPAQIDVVRAPLAGSGEPSRLSSLPQARSLRDWEVENIVLLATVDGAIHARDRKTGQERWALVPDSPMIETIHHRHNRSGGDGQTYEDDYRFFVEPSKDGNLFIFSDPEKGLQRLDITVRSLVYNTPLVVPNLPLECVASFETTMYDVDAASGTVLRGSGMYNAFVNDVHDRSCRLVSDFELDQTEPEPMGKLRLGRSQYTVNIRSTISNELLCRLKFSEWTTDHGNADLQNQHVTPLDDFYIQTFHDGRITGWDLDRQSKRVPRFTHVLESPVAQVFDVARPVNNQDGSGFLAVLLQPLDLSDRRTNQDWQNNNLQERVYVNQTPAGHWFAMSELSYPGVTTSAMLSRRFHGANNQEYPDLDNDVDEMVGVHLLAPRMYGEPQQLLTLGAATFDSDVALPPESGLADVQFSSPKGWHESPRASNLMTSAFIIMVASIVTIIYRSRYGVLLEKILSKMDVPLKSRGTTQLTARESTPEVDSVPDALVKHSRDEPTIGSTRSIGSSIHQVEQASGGARNRTESILQPEAETAADGQEQSSDELDEGWRPAEEGVTQGTEIGAMEGKKRRTKRGQRGRRGGKNNKQKPTLSPDELDKDRSVIVPEEHLENDMVRVGNIIYDGRVDHCLGQGSNGTYVFRGKLYEKAVAVKRLMRASNSLAAKEIKHLLSSDQNPHVIQYRGKEESHHFIYIALDLFTASLDQVTEHPERYPSLVKASEGLDIKDTNRQMATGVQYLHNLKLVHRDLKPQNILLRPVNTSRPISGVPQLQIVVSDFGLCKQLDDGPGSTFAPTANHTAAGTTGWRAPELLVDPRNLIAASNADSSASRGTIHSSEGVAVGPPSSRKASKAIDIFSLGCVFYYVMTQGHHPFDVGGTSLGRDLNIKENRLSTEFLRLYGYDYDADDLILQMLKHDSADRPDANRVLHHPYFWDEDKKLDFLCTLSDAYEHEKVICAGSESEEMEELQKLAPDVVGPSGDFLRALPRNFLTEMGKQRKYTGSRMLDLLRVIRNKKNHFHDLPDNVKEMMGGTPEGYYSFWAKRFPSLLVNCHMLVVHRNLVEKWNLGKYFA